ncbi:MAG: DNA-processing protein DprA [Longicatena sp.]
MKKQILYYALKYDGDWKKIQKAILTNETWNEIVYQGKYTTIVDEDYPEKLRRLQYAPWILFYEGDLALASTQICGIVGSRLCSSFGIDTCIHVVNLLKKRYTIVSGLAKGIDAIAHKTSLDMHTIAVIGCGLDTIYPKENAYLYQQIREHHLLLSEYPNGSKPFAYHFPWRNRIIAALSDALVVIEAKKRSGTLLSVNEALELDIPVYCIPHDFKKVEGMGCNLLLSQGANILIDDEDIMLI